jgi:protein-L-isoaspartate(D-aspartate) O-methyltransferase
VQRTAGNAVTTPVLFTIEFRKKMASLAQSERLDWLASVASRTASVTDRPGAGPPPELAEVARGCRLGLIDSIERHLGPFDPLHLAALLEVPRERFVRSEDLGRSADDIPLPLDDEGFATISAPHAYCLSFRLLGLKAGDRLIELGTGTGYGAALAAFIVGPAGHVTTFEIDHALASSAQQALVNDTNVTVVEGDALASADRWEGATKAVATFAVAALPRAWLDALPEGAVLVAPVGAPDRDQRLVRATRRGGAVVQTEHGAVRYVKNRSRL